MNTFVIYNGNQAVGVADYADEAREFAERIQNNPPGVYWQPITGKMYLNGQLTDWKIARMTPSVWRPHTMENVT